MPSYDLKCNDCENVFEITLFRFIRDEDKVCPSCGSTNVEQKLEVFEFRGTPWKPTNGPVLPLRSQAKWPSKKK
ncbi:MAG: zinc ribbon domain-containing protein [Thermoleophilia bacterium]|mgnify:CR=1 FL=1